jgi:hypothetical protein
MGDAPQAAQRHGQKGREIHVEGQCRDRRRLLFHGGEGRREGRRPKTGSRQPIQDEGACDGGKRVRRKSETRQEGEEGQPHQDGRHPGCEGGHDRWRGEGEGRQGFVRGGRRHEIARSFPGHLQGVSGRKINAEDIGKVLPWVHIAISNAKTRLAGIYHGIKAGIPSGVSERVLLQVQPTVLRGTAI